VLANIGYAFAQVTPIPTLSEWALVLLAMMMGAVMTYFRECYRLSGWAQAHRRLALTCRSDCCLPHPANGAERMLTEGQRKLQASFHRSCYSMRG